MTTDISTGVKSTPRGVVVSGTFTRPSNTDAYTAGDVMSAVTTGSPLAIANCAARTNGSGWITALTVILSQSGATALDFDLRIYDTEPAAQTDNGEFVGVDAEEAQLVAVVKFTAAADGSQGGDSAGSTPNVAYHKSGLSIPFVCATSTLWFVPVARSAYTPGSAETVTVRAGILQD